MSIFDFLKAKEFKARIAELENRNAELSGLLTPEMQDVIALQNRASELATENAMSEQRIVDMKESAKRDLEKADDELRQQKIAYRRMSEAVAEEQRSFSRVEEEIELEDFSLYRPRFAFTHAADYKDRLETCRTQQKTLIKDKRAATGNMGWTVNNSASKGKKLVEDMQKLCLRAFNCESDSAVEDVRFNNYDRCRDRILKTAKAIERLGAIMSVSISPLYLNCKLDELQLSLEYARKKQEEKEEQRAVREAQREEAKLQREIEEARRESEKEKKHYQNALAKVQASLASSSGEDEEILKEKENELLAHLGEIDKSIASIDYREANKRAGYVYIISNIGAFGEGVYKIGMTRRLEPQERVDELGSASVPFWFDVHAMIFSDDAPALEASLHQAFSDRRVNWINPRKEYFRVSIDEIEGVVRASHDKIVEFTKEASAEQYRETLIMQRSSDPEHNKPLDIDDEIDAILASEDEDD